MSHTSTETKPTTVTLNMAKQAHEQVMTVDHARARTLAERIDTLASHRFCDTGRLDNGFITDTRIYAAAGCPDMAALNLYVEKRIAANQGVRPSDWL